MRLPAGSLAGIGPSGELFRLRSDGAGNLATSVLIDLDAELPPALDRAPAALVWPLWSPDGAALFVSTIERLSAGRPPAQLLRVPLDGGEPLALYRNAEGAGQVGPNLPHYVNPSPDARHLAVLAQALPGGMALLFVDALGRGPAQPVGRGAPLFSAWSSGSDALLMHTGGELTIMELDSAPAVQRLAANHVAYRLPAWSPDGRRIAVAAPEGDGVMLQLVGRDGNPVATLGSATGTVAFTWSPDGALLALADGRPSNPPSYHNLRLLPVDGSKAIEVRVADCLAFLWSPDGSYLATLAPDTPDGRLSWRVVGRDGRLVRLFPPFRPAGDLTTYAAFFDQYALSHHLWSPDGSAILGFGRLTFNGTPPELLPPRIYSFDVASGEATEVYGGSIAFWSPVAG